MSLWRIAKELRRRRVFRVAGFYFVGAWALLQVADVVAEPAGFPAWFMTLLLYLILLGFPIALFLGWRYEFSDHGLVRTAPVKGEDYDPRQLALRTSDYVVFAGLIAVGTFAVWGIFGGDDPILNLESPTVQEVSAPAVSKEIAYDSIAVLPFVDMSPEGDQEYFGDGLADTLLHVLAQIKGFAFKGKDMLVGEIATELGVAHVLEGSVQTAGNQLRVIAQLIEAEGGTHLWSGTFTGPKQDVFSIQDEIAEEVVEALHFSILKSDENRLRERYQPNLDAYDQFVLGRHEVGKGTVAGLTAAVEHFERAIELDPDYPLPYVQLADTYRWLEVYAFGFQDSFSALPTQPTQELQRPLLEQALRLDPLSGEAYASLASIELDEEKAEAEFLEAIELSPNYVNAYLWYSMFLGVRQGRYEESLRQLEKAVELDPLSDIVQFNYAKAVWASGRAEQAMALMLENVRRNPDFPYNYKRMARWKLQTGKVGEAMLWIKALRRLEPDSPSHWGEFGGECHIYFLLGDPQEAARCFDEFSEAFPQSVPARRWRATRNAQASGEIVNLGNFNAATEEMVDLFRELVRQEPGNDYRANQLAFALERIGQFDELLDVMLEAHPQLFREPPEVSGETTWPAMMSAHALQELGHNQRAERLLEAIEQTIRGMRLIAGPGFTNGIENVEVAALRGNTEEALANLRNAINQNWRFTWDGMYDNLYLDSIKDDPRFDAMYEEIKADIARQREWFYANQDQPLF
jgi:TolB-like protein/tetratricopeptide (TPR) repeat protein